MKTKMKKQLAAICFVILLIGGAVIITEAQVASGGTYTLNQSVIAGGGGQNATGGTFALDGTIGQSIAGTNSTNGVYSLRGGFWTPAPLAPTAAPVTISGRVFAPEGRGLINARVVMTDSHGNSRGISTLAFGYFSFTDVPAGEVYIFTVVSKRFEYAPQVLFVSGDFSELLFYAAGRNLKYPKS